MKNNQLLVIKKRPVEGIVSFLMFIGVVGAWVYVLRDMKRETTRFNDFVKKNKSSNF
jgi:hypothetical protein